MSGADPSEIRHSQANQPDLVADPDQAARLEARNALRQFSVVHEMVAASIERGKFQLRPSQILGLHRVALEGLSAYAGNWRPADIKINASKHEPPPAHLVPELMENLCDYVNDHWSESPIHLAAYVMWRLNWVHPFVDGNGRTARAASYFVLCMRLGYTLPGTTTIPDQITDNRTPYYDALEEADKTENNGSADLNAMERLLQGMLATQLVSVMNEAQPNSK